MRMLGLHSFLQTLVLEVAGSDNCANTVSPVVVHTPVHVGRVEVYCRTLIGQVTSTVEELAGILGILVEVQGQGPID